MKRMMGMVAVAAMMSAGCGAGTNKRIVTRPDDYNKLVSFPSTGDPVDIPALIEEYPELRGIVMTAPEYIDEYEKLKEARDARGESIFEISISPGARIRIDVEGEPDLSSTLTVPPTGNWYFPYIGKVRLQGKDVEELKQYLEDRYAAVLKNPSVLVNLLSVDSTTLSPSGVQTSMSGGHGQIIVMGRVGTSQNFVRQTSYRGNETLVSVLQNLPGDAEWRQIRVIRRDAKNPLKKSRVIICDMWNFIAHGDVRQDIPLFPGDVVYVPAKWSVGQQFQHDWELVLGYMGDALFLDGFKDEFRKDGAFRD